MERYKLSILVAEDKEYMRNLIQKYILSNPTKTIEGVEIDYYIDFCETADEAILKYVGGEHDIVIMDLFFDKGDLNGIEATGELLEVNPRVQMIGMASEGEPRVDEFKASGIRFFLEKVFQDTYLWKRLDIISKEIIIKELNKPVETKKGFFSKGKKRS